MLGFTLLEMFNLWKFDIKLSLNELKQKLQQKIEFEYVYTKVVANEHQFVFAQEIDTEIGTEIEKEISEK